MYVLHEQWTPELLQLFQKFILWLWDIRSEKKTLSFPFCLVPLQRNLCLPSANLALLSLPSATANLHTICKTFILIDPSKDNPNLQHIQDLQQLLEDYKTDQM